MNRILVSHDRVELWMGPPPILSFGLSPIIGLGNFVICFKVGKHNYFALDKKKKGTSWFPMKHHLF